MLATTQGRATGLHIVQQALRGNGSLEARFETDEQRTYFLVEIFRHPAFAAADLDSGSGTGLDTDSDTNLGTESIEHEIRPTDLDRKILIFSTVEPRNRAEIMAHIGRANQSKTYRAIIRPLEERGWLTKTILDKPSSPRQRYQTTLLGRRVLEQD